MNEKPEILSFVKALASADRLRIIGVLVRGKASQSDIAEQLHLPTRDVFNHLAFLVEVGIVHEEDGLYDLDEKTIEAYARGQFEGKRQSFEAQGEKPEDVRKVLKSYLNADGTLKQIPPRGNKLLIVLNFIVDAFAYDTNYTEKEVNTILRRFHLDTAALRRYLVDNGFMAREGDGTRYWRVRKETE
jgi:DNA-binding transcriptional ArsR family regulator